MSSNNKKITTLVEDIYGLLEGEVALNEENVGRFAERLHSLLVKRLTKNDNMKPALRMSNFGTPCDRQLWYKINKPDLAEPLLPKTKLKFLFGDILEELLLFLASEAGHKVEGEQDTLELNGVTGHRDAVIDGVTVDVKSANARSFQHFARQAISPDNPFHAAYLDQLDLYMEAAKNDDRVKVKKEGAFLAFDKEMGGVALAFHKKRERDFDQEIEGKQKMLAQEEPPPRGFSDEPDGKSGNRKLPTACAYCAFKDSCWPGVRTFYYSNGPRYLTQVSRLPDVPEKGS